MMESQTFAGVEAGGTSFTVAIASGTPGNIVDRVSIPTTTPEETRNNVLDWLRKKKFSTLGVASFGPVDLDRNSSSYGHITTTPKPGWVNTNIMGWFDEFKCPKGFDTDVNGAAISEAFHGRHARGNITTCAYITVGTGVGVGVVVNSSPVHGLVHPEGGHVYTKLLDDDHFAGTCPFHGNCIEGLVSTGAISKRLGVTADKLNLIPDDDPVWRIVGHYLGQLCANLTCIISPHVIVLGGGVLNREILYPIVREETLKILNGYIKSEYLTNENIDKYIVKSPYGSQAGIVGAIELGKRAAN